MLALVGLVGLALLVAARNLEPDTRGFGTHEQLGLAPCYFLESTGYICPMCGSTTAWAHVVRGELLLAANANLGGTLLCMAVVVGSVWMLVAAIWGRWPIDLPRLTPRLKTILIIASAWLAVVVFDWLRRVYLGM